MQWMDCAVWLCQTWRRRPSNPASPALAARPSYSLLNTLTPPLNPLTPPLHTLVTTYTIYHYIQPLYPMSYIIIIIIGELKSHSYSGDCSSNNSKSHPTFISATGSHSTPASVEEVRHSASTEEVSHPASVEEVSYSASSAEGDTASAGELESSFQEIISASEASETERSVTH